MTTATAPETGTASGSILRTEIADGVAVVTMDLPGEPVNKITPGVRQEMATTLERLQHDPAVRAVVLISGKPDGFIAGADIDELKSFTSAADVERLSREGHALLDRVESGKPVVAAIHGACLGAGLEIALACAYRIVTDHPKTILALPEVMLGLIPGAGGTQRLPKLIGLQAALDMILTGKNVRAKKAYQLGLADELVHPSILRRVAVERAKEFAAGTRDRHHERKHAGAVGALKDKVLDDTPFGRNVVFKKARETVMKKTQGNMPAPLAALEAVAAGYGSREKGYREEARLFGEVAASDVSKQLTYLFFASNALKKDAGVPEPAPEPLAVDKIAILGAGFMGAGIASVAAPAGTLIRLKDADHQRVAKGIAAVRDVVKERLTRKQITRPQFDDTMSLVGGTVDYSGFGNVELVIEAVFEDLKVKHQVLKEVEAVAPPSVIFASNTSTIPIARIAQASQRPGRVIGMHFFSPVHKMPLLEVIVTPETDPQVTTTVVAYGKKLGKTVIVVNDGAGFYANRILSPYINEAGKLLDEGVAIDAVDRALVQFGFPVGPITLIDEVGIDVAGKVGNIIADAFGERMAPSQTLQKVVAAGRTGRKGKKGFYLYDEQGKKGEVDASVYELTPAGPSTSPRRELPPDEIQRRTVFAMLNEAVRCLEDDIIRSPRDGDIGAVFGIGFPPFRGGPFRYMDSLGAAAVVRTLDELNARFAPRFEAAQLLRDMAQTGKRFHPEG